MTTLDEAIDSNIFISKKQVLKMLGNRLFKPDTWGNKVLLRELMEVIEKMDSIDVQEEINYAMFQFQIDESGGERY